MDVGLGVAGRVGTLRVTLWAVAEVLGVAGADSEVDFAGSDGVCAGGGGADECGRAEAAGLVERGGGGFGGDFWARLFDEPVRVCAVFDDIESEAKRVLF